MRSCLRIVYYSLSSRRLLFLYIHVSDTLVLLSIFSRIPAPCRIRMLKTRLKNEKREHLECNNSIHQETEFVCVHIDNVCNLPSL